MDEEGYGVGVVIRDWMGQIHRSKDPERVSPCWNLQTQRRIYVGLSKHKGDFHVYFEKIKNTSMDIMAKKPSDVYALEAGFHHFKLHFVPRECNTVFTKLASVTKTLIS